MNGFLSVTILRLICGVAGVILLGVGIVWLASRERNDYLQRLDQLVPSVPSSSLELNRESESLNLIED